MSAFVPYIARPIRYLGLAQPHGFRIKKYAILFGGGPFREDDFAAGLEPLFFAFPTGSLAGEVPRAERSSRDVSCFASGNGSTSDRDDSASGECSLDLGV